ncbi:ABC transporter ATP-binding protein [Telmatospirillum sp. J64-1]|uniref:ABC transporter ATP-binding protein n=1 Tax=Telmatospirillum sp. J64-1 TaxID=2502183 RepID=UPI00163D7075|nr:ATP-binding cassette domain-containing protein [Telmatospirillum sp. J64-1]
MGVITIQAHGLGKRFQRSASPGAGSLKEALHRRLNPRATREDAGFWGLRELSVEIRQGEVVGLIGANGAGKSTFLKMIAGIMRPNEGALSVRGRVGPLLQEGTGFHHDLTARENLFLRGALLGMTRRQTAERMDRIVAFADGQDMLDQPVKRLSTGARMRLAWSVAVHAAPDIYLVDEVLAVVDAAFRNRCVDHIRRQQDRPHTALIVSHDLSILEEACNRILWLDKGRLRGDSRDVAGMLREYRALS